ncbi:hypothetical protein [Kordiimonas sp.]|uniref:hypothetical protein n=1 Tax=Kordiimonas sp. TaxID=1970157 RepID=UPI003A945101
MAITLYLHIGYPKCGSTTIQEALYENRKVLRAMGYGVCGRTLDLLGPRSKLWFPVGYFKSHLDAARDGNAPDMEPEFKALHARAAAAGLHSVVISAENLSAVQAPGLLASAKKYFDCRVIFYFRRQDDWLTSSWAQWQFKGGEGLTAFVRRRLSMPDKLLFRPVLESYLEHFARDVFRVRLLSGKYLTGGDLCSDFWHAVGIDGGLMQRVVSRNVSFSTQLAGVLKESPYLFEDAHDNELTGFIDEQHKGRRGAKKDALSHDMRAEILDFFKNENDWLETTFFQGGGLGDWLKLPDTGPSALKPDLAALDDASLRGVSELLNLNMVVLKELRQDVDKIKRALGIK